MVAEHDVARLQVAVEDAPGVGVGDGGGDLQEDLDERREAVRPLERRVAGAKPFEDLVQGTAVHLGHRVVGRASGGEAQLEDGDHVGVLELRQDLRLVDQVGRRPATAAADRLQGCERPRSRSSTR